MRSPRQTEVWALGGGFLLVEEVRSRGNDRAVTPFQNEV